MYILKNNKLPKFHLKFNGYKIENKNDKIIGYIKTIASKDENNYAMFYFIHIAYNLKNERSEVYVTWKKYNPWSQDWMYFWSGGDDSGRVIPIIAQYDKKLLKYLKYID